MVGSVKHGLLLLGDRRVWLRRGVELVLAISAGVMALEFISQMRQSHPALPPYMGSASPATSQGTARWAADIAQHHLFGEPAGSVKIAQTTGGALSLTGIIYSTNPDDSRAMLQADGTTLVVASGTLLPDGGKVASIGVDRIDIERGGTTEELVLKIDAADFSSDPSFASLDRNSDLDEDPSGQTLSASSNAATPSAPITQVFHASAVPLSAIRGKGAKERFKTLLPPVLPAKKANKP
jgi:hypothetical protein